MENKYLNPDGLKTVLKNLKTVFSLVGHKHTKADISDFPSSLPANGGNSDTVGGFTVKTNVPADAKFTDTGTLTGIKMNGASKGTSGVVDLGSIDWHAASLTSSIKDLGQVSDIYIFCGWRLQCVHIFRRFYDYRKEWFQR